MHRTRHDSSFFIQYFICPCWSRVSARHDPERHLLLHEEDTPSSRGRWPRCRHHRDGAELRPGRDRCTRKQRRHFETRLPEVGQRLRRTVRLQHQLVHVREAVHEPECCGCCCNRRHLQPQDAQGRSQREVLVRGAQQRHRRALRCRRLQRPGVCAMGAGRHRDQERGLGPLLESVQLIHRGVRLQHLVDADCACSRWLRHHGRICRVPTRVRRRAARGRSSSCRLVGRRQRREGRARADLPHRRGRQPDAGAAGLDRVGAEGARQVQPPGPALRGTDRPHRSGDRPEGRAERQRQARAQRQGTGWRERLRRRVACAVRGAAGRHGRDERRVLDGAQREGIAPGRGVRLRLDAGCPEPDQDLRPVRPGEGHRPRGGHCAPRRLRTGHGGHRRGLLDRQGRGGADAHADDRRGRFLLGGSARSRPRDDRRAPHRLQRR